MRPIPRLPRRLKRLALAALWLTLLLFVVPLLVSPFLPRPAGAARSEVGHLPILSRATETTRVDPRLSQVASFLARIGTYVYCWSEAEWQRNEEDLAGRLLLPPRGAWGAYRWQDPPPTAISPGGVDVIHLAPSICAELTTLSHPYVSVRGPEADAFAWSVSALAHEAQHVAGISNEAEAECYGMQTIAEAARKLGRTAADARYLASRYWERWYRWIDDEIYSSSECRNGGRLDLHRDTDVWP